MLIGRITAALSVLALALVGCASTVADRSAQAHSFTASLRALPGVLAAQDDVAHNEAQGMVFFRIAVDVAANITADQVDRITGAYLRNVDASRYPGYRLELDLRQGWNLFAVDSGQLPITNPDQVLSQSKDWIALRDQFPGATVRVRATITHPGGQAPDRDTGHSNVATLDLATGTDYTAVAAAARTLSERFPWLAQLDWTINAAKEHPAEIKSSRRFPSAAELAVFTRLNADQTIPHIDRLRINSPIAAPVWFAEQTTQSRDVTVALQLARAHLPVAAGLPAPVLYTASDELSGHIGGRGFARGPVAVTIGGCTPHDPLVYLPIPEERQLIKRYETCAA